MSEDPYLNQAEALRLLEESLPGVTLTIRRALDDSNVAVYLADRKRVDTRDASGLAQQPRNVVLAPCENLVGGCSAKGPRSGIP